jgi:hydrogenase maturation protease
MILVAGVGNIFQGDDGFGVAVAQRLARMTLPQDVRVVDYGIRGIDLTYALMDGPDTVILVDAAARGLAPGTVSLVEPERAVDAPLMSPILSAHDLDPAKVMQLVEALGGSCGRVLLIACEPADLGDEDGKMGLSPMVEAAIEPAVEKILSLLAQMIARQAA